MNLFFVLVMSFKTKAKKEVDGKKSWIKWWVLIELVFAFTSTLNFLCLKWWKMQIHPAIHSYFLLSSFNLFHYLLYIVIVELETGRIKWNKWKLVKSWVYTDDKRGKSQMFKVQTKRPMFKCLNFQICFSFTSCLDLTSEKSLILFPPLKLMLENEPLQSNLW